MSRYFLILLLLISTESFSQKVAALGIIRAEDERLLTEIKPGERFSYSLKWRPTEFKDGSTLMKIENDTIYTERTVKKKLTQSKHHISEIYGIENIDWGKVALKLALQVATKGVLFINPNNNKNVTNFVQGNYYLKQVEVDAVEEVENSEKK